MALDYKKVYWEWDQGGETWGFDPREDLSRCHPDEKAAAEALSTSQKSTIVTTQAWKCVRSIRDEEIAKTDWTQGADVPTTLKNKWSTYRQALRDVPQNNTDPDNITWPTKPS
jgi:hypothetical protein